MIRLYIRHTVHDYAAWRVHYDAFDKERQTMGVIGAGVARNVDNPNDVTVWHDFEDLATSKRFFRSDRLRDVMAHAGVAHAPTFWLTEFT